MPKHSDRKVEIYNAFKDSLQRLREVLAEKETRITRDAAIHRFEFTVELAWKCIQDFLRGEEIICRSPKECLKSAFSYGLIKDDPRWVEMIEDRNLTVHTYNETTAEKIYVRLPAYFDLLEELNKSFEKSDV